MRIAIYADPIDEQFAGVHTYTRELLRTVIQNDKENEYIIFKGKTDKRFPDARVIVVPRLGWTLIFPLIRKFFILPALARKYKVDAVIEPASIGPFNLPSRIKRISVIHDLSNIKFPHFYNIKSQFLKQYILNRVIRKADLILTNSENTRLDLIKQYPYAHEKVKRLYLGRDEDFKPDHNTDILDKYGITKPYFLFVSTIEPRKNLKLLLKAYQKFCSTIRDDIKLVVIGKRGDKCRAIEKSIDANLYRKNIITPGYISKDELPQLYTNTTAFVYPSLYEGFGLPVLEAMSCGSPCIISNASSLPEVAGDAALLFNPFDQQELVTLLEKVSQDENLRKELSDKSIKRSRIFSWDEYANSLKSIINRDLFS